MRFTQSTTNLVNNTNNNSSFVMPPPDYRQALRQKYQYGRQNQPFMLPNRHHRHHHHHQQYNNNNDNQNNNGGKRWPTFNGIDQHDLPDCHPAVLAAKCQLFGGDDVQMMTRDFRQVALQAQSEPRLVGANMWPIVASSQGRVEFWSFLLCNLNFQV